MTTAGGALEGRTAIVTGAAQGIGRRVAERFADEGAWVVIADIQGDLAHEVAGSILGNGGRALAIRTDVADAESVDGPEFTIKEQQVNTPPMGARDGPAVGRRLEEAR